MKDKLILNLIPWTMTLNYIQVVYDPINEWLLRTRGLGPNILCALLIV